MMDTVGNKAARARDRDDQGGGAEHGAEADRPRHPGARRRRRVTGFPSRLCVCAHAAPCASSTARTRCTRRRWRGWSCASTQDQSAEEEMSLVRGARADLSGEMASRMRKPAIRLHGEPQVEGARSEPAASCESHVAVPRFDMLARDDASRNRHAAIRHDHLAGDEARAGPARNAAIGPISSGMPMRRSGVARIAALDPLLVLPQRAREVGLDQARARCS